MYVRIDVSLSLSLSLSLSIYIYIYIYIYTHTHTHPVSAYNSNKYRFRMGSYNVTQFFVTRKMYLYALIFNLLLFITLYIRGKPEMSTPHEKTQCVVPFNATRSDLQTQCDFRAKCRRALQSRPSICEWHIKFVETVAVVW